MSFNSSRRKSLDETLPLQIRASHVRSCALLVAEKFKLTREAVIADVASHTGIDLHNLGDGENILTAIECLEHMRQGEVLSGARSKHR